ncbi:Cupredoxin [Suillus americanus]|nr:Cupredoxin [Suillus americanus]
MFTPILIASFISSINAAAIISRSQSYPLSQRSALGPQTKLTIGNKVIAPDGFERSATLVNGEYPGPLIAAQKGDNFAIEVANELTDSSMFTSTSVHWHGIYQNGTSYADGTASVTQCPIAQNQSYLHSFSAQNQAGTFWYHSHYSVQYATDGQLTEPLEVDQLQIYAGQRYSVVLVADQPTDNYWVRNLPNTANASFVGGTNSAILRYTGAPLTEPTTVNTTSTNPLVETNLHALTNPVAPGIPEYGAADINLNLQVSAVDGNFYVNNVSFAAPTVPVLLQILSGAQDATQLMPNDSVIILEANKVVELTLSTTGLGGPHPVHLHGHSFSVVQSAGNSSLNYVNPVRRDVVSAGSLGQQMVIRWVTDNSGPWFLHCHIDWHLDVGFAVVMAESPSETRANMQQAPDAWDQLCPTFNALAPSQLGGTGLDLYEAAANMSTNLYPPPAPLPSSA